MKIFQIFFLFAFGTIGVLGSSCYSPKEKYTADSKFFDNFVFETFDDPTHGFVDYIDQGTAESLGLVKYEDGKVYIGADYTNVVGQGERGRKSIRLTSKLVLNGNNLIVIDLEHMPTTSGVTGTPKGCSIWPAFWTFGPNWPYSGEIDMIEYVNIDSDIQTTLHTSDGCDQTSEDTSTFSGSWALTGQNIPSSNCFVNATGQWQNAGCGIIGPSNTVGNAFNQNGVKGGVFVLEWAIDDSIRSFYFPRDRIPGDLTKGSPNPDSWGKPFARFGLNDACPSSHFVNHQIIFDTTFCGDWAGNTFNSVCGSQNCVDFVRNNPNEFTETYWLINSLSIYDKCTTSSSEL